ncbi:uncharacterized protein LOC126592923 [Malus sylvestris]|uniref:uncharacterized protein LOC126592923 n=1 Tax=Malus sylvestris TaxID=3752 RepID=UPI0010AAC192|nr:uncharacterized protein LOC103449743 [Malus domestica]XP_028946546.1 uncharacterized protein LOC103449743 [Malus domestica]XP_050114686.1 uncharacterized protein LOC126592923 [Malus sylvestris]XP_050114687.1 uncharacterized protein LOC126592923 [Malus sylvestris]XP_050114688.1 uncharacterized protein LOC126592923 [Malus sylvestris]
METHWSSASNSPKSLIVCRSCSSRYPSQPIRRRPSASTLEFFILLLGLQELREMGGLPAENTSSETKPKPADSLNAISINFRISDGRIRYEEFAANDEGRDRLEESIKATFIRSVQESRFEIN